MKLASTDTYIPFEQSFRRRVLPIPNSGGRFDRQASSLAKNGRPMEISCGTSSIVGSTLRSAVNLSTEYTAREYRQEFSQVAIHLQTPLCLPLRPLSPLHHRHPLHLQGNHLLLQRERAMYRKAKRVATRDARQSYYLRRISNMSNHLSHIHKPHPSRRRNPRSHTGILHSEQSRCNPRTLPTAHSCPTNAPMPGPSDILPPSILRLCNNSNPAWTVDNLGLDRIPVNVD